MEILLKGMIDWQHRVRLTWKFKRYSERNAWLNLTLTVLDSDVLLTLGNTLFEAAALLFHMQELLQLTEKKQGHVYVYDGDQASILFFQGASIYESELDLRYDRIILSGKMLGCFAGTSEEYFAERTDHSEAPVISQFLANKMGIGFGFQAIMLDNHDVEDFAYRVIAFVEENFTPLPAF
jgi:hypothetical protein